MAFYILLLICWVCVPQIDFSQALKHLKAHISGQNICMDNHFEYEKHNYVVRIGQLVGFGQSFIVIEKCNWKFSLILWSELDGYRSLGKALAHGAFSQ